VKALIQRSERNCFPMDKDPASRELDKVAMMNSCEILSNAFDMSRAWITLFSLDLMNSRR
jgi:hypothetical protein